MENLKKVRKELTQHKNTVAKLRDSLRIEMDEISELMYTIESSHDCLEIAVENLIEAIANLSEQV